MRIYITALTCAVFLLAGTQSAASNEHAHGHGEAAHKSNAKPFTGFVKPGAAVTLSHDYDGKTGLGELETFTATLSHIYQDGALSVELLAAPHIQISAFTPIYNMPVYKGSTLDLPIQFSGTKAGDFTISLERVYKAPDRQESRRVVSVPVNIGGEVLEKALDSGDADVKTDFKSGLIALTAIEVIE